MRKIRIVLFGVGAAALRMAVVTSLPDIKRYIRMRQMWPGEPLSPDTAVAVGRAGDGHHGRSSGRYPDV